MFRSLFGTFTLKPNVEDVEIEFIPRRKPRQSKDKTKIRKSFEQSKCIHKKCLDFQDSFDRHSDFSQWKNSVTKCFKSKNHNEQLNYLAQMITFTTPKKSKDRQKWQNNDREFRYSYPKSYRIEIPNPSGLGKTKVCSQYFRYIFCFGKAKFQSIMTAIWQSRSSGQIHIHHEQNYKGYCNKRQEADWISRWEQYALNHKHLSRSHYVTDKETVYFDLENGRKHNWYTIWADFIKHDQPQTYDNYVNKNRSIDCDESIAKPYPSYKHFLTVIPHVFNCKSQRVDQDKCNGCRQLNVLLSKAESTEKRKIYESQHIAHLRRASMCYQLKTHYKNFAINSFHKRSITVRRLKKPKIKYPGTQIHYEIDYDLDHPECITNLNMSYFKRKITIKSLNMIQYPADERGSRKVFAWSQLVGGKQTEETVQCLKTSFQTRSIGAERCSVNLDGALLTYKLLQFSGFSCHGKNPKKYFRSIHVLSPETGHTRLEADTINAQVATQYNKKESFSTCKERVDYINENTNIEMMQFQYFATLPEIYDTIFIDPQKWQDQFGKKALIRDDKGMIYEFGESQVWNEEKSKFEWVKHHDEMWIRCHEDLKKPVRKLKIFKKEIHKLKKDKLTKLKISRKPNPSIKKETLRDTLEIAKLLSNAEDLMKYYTPTEIDESGEIKYVPCTHNYKFITTKIERRLQFQSMLEDGKARELTKYERKSKADESEECDAHLKYTMHDLNNKNLKVCELKEELKNHGKKRTGKKADLLQRLIEHYKIHLDSD